MAIASTTYVLLQKAQSTSAAQPTSAKITSFNLIRLHLQKKDNFGDIHPRLQRVISFQVWTRNGSCSSYCRDFYVLEVFLICFRFEKGRSGPFQSATGSAIADRSN